MGDLSFEDYSRWCRSRFPAIDPGDGPVSTADTVLASPSDEACPVTVRSAHDERVVLTPRGSR